jgi:hypothetical protein
MLFVGVHNVSVWGQVSGWHGRTTDSGVGPEEHGIRPATERVQSQIPDSLYPMLPEQTGICTQLNRRYGLTVFTASLTNRDMYSAR